MQRIIQISICILKIKPGSLANVSVWVAKPVALQDVPSRGQEVWVGLCSTFLPGLVCVTSTDEWSGRGGADNWGDRWKRHDALIWWIARGQLGWHKSTQWWLWNLWIKMDAIGIVRKEDHWQHEFQGPSVCIGGHIERLKNGEIITSEGSHKSYKRERLLLGGNFEVNRWHLDVTDHCSCSRWSWTC